MLPLAWPTPFTVGGSSRHVQRNEAETGCTVTVQTSTAGGRGAKVVLAIPATIEQASWRWLAGKAHLLAAGYSTHLQHAGATVMMLPVPSVIGEDLDLEAASIVAMLDGLVIAGGADVDPKHYGEDPVPESGPFSPERDAWELALVRAAVAAGVPVLGICRGHQLLNVVLGGTIIQHLPPHVNGSGAHQPFPEAFGEHTVQTVAGSWLRDAIGEQLDVATFHHQAIDTPGAGLTVTATTTDGTIEGVEDLARGLIGVQWHPEMREHAGVFERFVELCEERRGQRS